MKSRIPKSWSSSPFSRLQVVILLLSVYLVQESFGSEGDDIDPCSLPKQNEMYCYCPEDYQTEEIKCQVGKGVKIDEGDPRWASFKKLNLTRSLIFINRPERSFSHFPSWRMFPGMSSLLYFASKLSEFSMVPSFAFGNSSSLSDVTLVDDAIEVLAPNAFGNMANLTRLNLGENLIREINRGVFVNLSKLTGLYLDKNHIQIIHEDAFKELGHLEELELQHNNMTALIRESFVGLKHLKRLDLRSNTIDYLGDHVFAEMPNLEDLDLAANKILSVSSSAFSGLKQITRLILQENKIVVLHPPTFTHLHMIHLLDLRNNELESLSWSLIHPIYPNLKNISMQLMVEGNRFVCDCPLLWMARLYTESESVSVKEHLSKTECDFFQKPDHSHHTHQTHHHVKESHVGRKTGNVTVVAAAPEETTTYQSYNGQKPVIQLNAEDLKCHHDSGHKKGSNTNGHWNADERELVDKESHDESAPSKEVLTPQHDRHAAAASAKETATEKSQFSGDSEKDIIQQSHHSLTETSLPDKSSSSHSHSQSLAPSAATATFSASATSFLLLTSLSILSIAVAVSVSATQLRI